MDSTKAGGSFEYMDYLPRIVVKKEYLEDGSTKAKVGKRYGKKEGVVPVKVKVGGRESEMADTEREWERCRRRRSEKIACMKKWGNASIGREKRPKNQAMRQERWKVDSV